jgi:hypothetical protein
MAEMTRQLTQAEVDRILFNQRMNMQPQSIQNLNPSVSGSVTPIPQNLFQRMGLGAKASGDYVNRAGTAADVAKLFPGYTGQSQFNIPTGFNFAPKQSPTGEVIPGGLQTNQVNVNQLLSAIKPADVLGLTGAQQAYTDVGIGRVPNPMDVVDTLALGAGGIAAGKGLLGSVKATKGMPVGMSIKDVSGSGQNVNLQALANEAMAELRANPTAKNKQKYIEARDRASAEFVALRESPDVNKIAPEESSYKGQHTAPMNDSGKPLWDLSEIYPDDFYSSQGARFYGHGEDLGRDMRIVAQIQSFKGRPDRPVTIYRAVPKDVPKGQGINKGDWITTDRQYAKEHGQGALGDNYKIIKKTVKARDIFTNGDSIYEFGYDPQPFIPKSQRIK